MYEDEVRTDLDDLSKEIYKITNGAARLVERTIADVDAKTYFKGEKIYDASYKFGIEYTHPDTGEKTTNYFLAVTHSGVYPVVANYLKGDTGASYFSGRYDFVHWLKVIVNYPSVLASIRLAIRASKKKPQTAKREKKK